MLFLNIYGADYFSNVLVFVGNKDVFWIFNKYKWSELFLNEINYRPVWLGDFEFLKTIEMDSRLIESFPLIYRYAWKNILYDSKFDVF